MPTTLRDRRAEFKRVYREARADDSQDSTIIVLPNKRIHRANFAMGLLREVPAVFTVVTSGASAVQGEHQGIGLVLAAAELLAGAAVLVAIGFEARHLFGNHNKHADAAHGNGSAAPHKKPLVDYPSLAAATLGFVEAWSAHLHHHFKLWSPEVVGAVASLIVGYMRNRPVSPRRGRRNFHVGITPSGIRYLAGLHGAWSVPWTDVAAIEHDRGELAVRLHDGRRHVIRAEDHFDGEAVLHRTHEAIATHAAYIPGAR